MLGYQFLERREEVAAIGVVIRWTERPHNNSRGAQAEAQLPGAIALWLRARTIYSSPECRMSTWALA